MLRQAIGQTIVTGEWHRGIWSDVGTLERLEAIREIVQ
jgi:hypothetical protein